MLETASLRKVERDSIRAFIDAHREFLTGLVLDYGCGKEPYRDVVAAAGGSYHGYDRSAWPANVSGRDIGDGLTLHNSWDTVMSTQVIQYVADPLAWLESIRKFIRHSGFLVITGPTNWPIVEVEDRWRFTPTGIASLLNSAGFFVVDVKPRACVQHNDESWLLGWGAVARA